MHAQVQQLFHFPIPQKSVTYAHELVIDFFAGGGGASSGIEAALGRPVDHAINHDAVALTMHEANHPFTSHHVEDVFAVDPRALCGDRPVGLFWGSPDCTHHSRAKGGQPVRKDIRGLAWVIVKWAGTVKPRVIMLENVPEFQDWGPLHALRDETGVARRDPETGQMLLKANRRRKGKNFKRFVWELRNLGYAVEWRKLRACDYGAPTTRERLFLIARCDQQPIVWPEVTHGPRTEQPHRAAAECIDWTINAPSIFERKRPLATKTLRRIAEGLGKFVVSNPKPFIVPVSHATANPRTAPAAAHITKFRGDSPGSSAAEPMPTITGGGKLERAARNSHALGVVAAHISTFYGDKDGAGVRGSSLEQPIATQTTENRFGLVTANLIQTGYGEREGQKPRVLDIERPLGTVVAGGQKHALVAASIVKHYGGTYNGSGSSLEDPLHTITAYDHNSLMVAHIARQFGTGIGHRIDAPLATVMPHGDGKSQLVTTYLDKYYGASSAASIEAPLDTITARDRFSQVNAEFEGVQKHAEEVYALMLEHAPQYLTDTDHATRTVGVAINEWRHVITDVGMRMLQPAELYRAQGFDARYDIAPIFDGKPLTKTAQVRLVGNSVPPPVAEALVRANLCVPLATQTLTLEMAAD